MVLYCNTNKTWWHLKSNQGTVHWSASCLEILQCLCYQQDYIWNLWVCWQHCNWLLTHSIPYKYHHTSDEQLSAVHPGTQQLLNCEWSNRRTSDDMLHPNHHQIFISSFHLPRSIASSLFKLRAWQSFCTTSFHVLFDLPLGLEPSTSYSIHFFTNQCLLFTARAHTIATCFAVVSILYHLFLVFLSTPYLSFILTLHIHLTILISARWSATKKDRKNLIII